VHAIGNGNMLVYGRGPDIIQLFGPDYTGPSYLSLSVLRQNNDLYESTREAGTAIWTHKLFPSSEGWREAPGWSYISEVVFTDYVLPYQNIFIRDINCTSPIRLQLTLAPHVFGDLYEKSEVQVYDMGEPFTYIHRHARSLLMRFPRGTLFAKRMSTHDESSLLFTVEGNIEIKESEDGDFELQIYPGQSRILMCCYHSYADAFEALEYVFKQFSAEDGEWPPLQECREYWRDFTARRRDFTKMIPVNHPHREKALELIDSVSVLIKCQQSADGGVMAGHHYCFAYVRDMSGVLRGLMELGYFHEARAILQYWIRIFTLYGNLCVADGMGNESGRLPWTNDEVEITSYILLDFIYFYERTGEMPDGAEPLLKWAFEVQIPHIAGGMIEFNSDETYIACGVLPVRYTYNGSAESTMMFITGGERLLSLARQNAWWSPDKLDEYDAIVKDMRDKFKENFTVNGRFYVNNPLREKFTEPPRFRHGVCQADDCTRGGNRPLTWLERNGQGYYVCPKCRDKTMKPMEDRKSRYELGSVSMKLLYNGGDLFSEEEIRQIITPYFDIFRKTNRVPSDAAGTRSIGYDYGLMRYNAVVLDDPARDDLLVKTLSTADSTGAWAECYDNDKPEDWCCRCRAWESAINIEAIIKYFEGGKKNE